MAKLFTQSKFAILLACMSASASAANANLPRPTPTPAPTPPPLATPSAKHDANNLSCADIRSRVRLFLDLHLVHKEFSDTLSRRTFAKNFELADPERLFLTTEDIDQFKPIEDRLNALVAKKNCTFIDAIAGLVNEKAKERSEWISAWLANAKKASLPNTSAPPPSFSKSWAPNRAELDERWAKKILSDLRTPSNTISQESIFKSVLKRYTKIVSSIVTRSRDEVYSNFLNSFALSLDPHSAHFLPLDQDEFNSRLGNPVDGVGITLSDLGDAIVIESIAPDSPADKSGALKIGDELIEFVELANGRTPNITQYDAAKAMRLMRGKKDSEIKLTFSRVANNEKVPPNFVTVTLKREVSRLKSISARSAMTTVSSKKIGIVKLPAFYTDVDCRSRILPSCQGSAAEVRSHIERLKEGGMEALVLDLRNNNGGDLQESIRLAGLFIASGPILQIVDRTGVPRVQTDPDPRVSYSGPLAVLVNKNSASAAEIVALAIKDLERGLVVGDSRTFGKGTIQVIQDLDLPGSKTREGMLKVTQAIFYGPKGKSAQKYGVRSDIVIPSATEFDAETEGEKDFVLDAPPIKLAPDFKPQTNPILSQLEKLSQKSAARVAEDPNFTESKLKNSDKKNHGRNRDTPPDESFPATSDFQLQETISILANALEK